MPLWLDVEGRAVVSEGDPMEWGSRSLAASDQACGGHQRALIDIVAPPLDLRDDAGALTRLPSSA